MERSQGASAPDPLQRRRIPETEGQPDSHREERGEEEIRPTSGGAEETERGQAAPDRRLLQQARLSGEGISKRVAAHGQVRRCVRADRRERG